MIKDQLALSRKQNLLALPIAQKSSTTKVPAPKSPTLKPKTEYLAPEPLERTQMLATESTPKPAAKTSHQICDITSPA